LRKLKGFTLVECIVAMTVFAIAALTMAQVYVSIATVQRENEYMQYSLANQMKYAENETNTEAVPIKYTDTFPTGAADGGTVLPSANNANYVTLYKVDLGADGRFDGLTPVDDKVTYGNSSSASQTYEVGIDMFILKSRTGTSQDPTAGGDIDATYDDDTRVNTDEQNYNVRYKYFIPANG
jgi:prepilin-type N-terminal cleavage/methylation domain-containing protein